MNNTIGVKILGSFHNLLKKPFSIALRESPIVLVQIREKVLIA